MLWNWGGEENDEGNRNRIGLVKVKVLIRDLMRERGEGVV
jgi:hypothetical protein